MIPDEDDTCACPLCVEPPPGEIVEMVMRSAASQGPAMTGEEFLEWLDGVGREGPDVTGE